MHNWNIENEQWLCQVVRRDVVDDNSIEPFSINSIRDCQKFANFIMDRCLGI